MGDLLGSYSGCVRVRTKHAGKDTWWFVRPVIIPISSSGGTPDSGPGELGSGCYKWYQSDLATVSVPVDRRRGAPRAPPSKGDSGISLWSVMHNEDVVSFKWG
ncbi:hypothetical protein PTKIN_Ptkin16aG0038100 [Pterospermum kingtungense]